MQTCRTDGWLLKPDQPAVYLDLTYAWSFIDLLPRLVFDTHSIFELDGASYTWHYIVSANLTASLNVTPGDLALDPEQDQYVYDWHDPIGTLTPFSASTPLQLPANKIPPPNNATSDNCTFAPCWQVRPNLSFLYFTVEQTIDWRYYVTAPVLWNRFVILGELSKFVPLSTQRLQTIRVVGDSIEMEVLGAPHESVNITVMQPQHKFLTASCMLSGLGVARATCSEVGCWCF